MEVSLRDAKARLSELIQVASQGETVIITRHGHPAAELVPVRRRSGVNFAELDRVQEAMGLKGVSVEFAAEFNDPHHSRRALGLEDDA